MGWCCPCILFGKTQARLEDPSLKEYSPVNENVSLESQTSQPYTKTVLTQTALQCLLWCGLSCFGASFLIQTKKRQELRKKYNITGNDLEPFLKKEPGHIKNKHDVDGSVVEDCLGAFFCRCCGLVQEEKEVVLRQQNVNGTGYQAPQGMDYKP